MKIALVFGGGGARGLAHVGILRVLEREKIHYDLIVGCSSGALIGGMYAQTPRIDRVEKKLRLFFGSEEYKELGLDLLSKQAVNEDYMSQFLHNVRNRVLLNIFAGRISILKEKRLERVINYLIKEGSIRETAVPFACNATDIVTGKPVLFTEGEMRTAILASSSVPGYIPPVTVDGRLLIDGAVTHSFPVRFARALGADYVIGVDVHPTIRYEENFRNFFDVIMRASMITGSMLSEETQRYADFLIRPDVGDFLWYEFDRYEEIIAAGEKIMEAQLEALKADLPRRRLKKIRQFFGHKEREPQISKS